MTDTPTAYPPPQLVITYSGGRYHVDVAGEEGQMVVDSRLKLATICMQWADNAQQKATP